MAPTESKDEVKKEAVHSSTGSPKRRVSDFDIYMYGESYVNSSAYLLRCFHLCYVHLIWQAKLLFCLHL